MYSTELYERARRPRPASTRAGAESAGCGSRPRPSGSRSCAARQSAAATYGLELDVLSAEEARERLPLLAVDDVLAAAWLPGDGYVDPELLAGALARGRARRSGVELPHRHPCHRLRARRRPPRRRRAPTADTIATETAVIAAGAATGAVGRLAGASIPIVPMRHQYLVTEPLDPAVSAEATTVRDPDHIVYFRPEDGRPARRRLLARPGHLGRRRPAGRAADALRRPTWSASPSPGRARKRRVPALRDAEIAKVVNGPEAFTPDGEFILGETPEVDRPLGRRRASACTASPAPAGSAR